MSARRTELLVVGALVLGFVGLGAIQLGTERSADQSHKAADDAVARGQLHEAERAAGECDLVDGGTGAPDERLSCIARLAGLEYGLGKAAAARERLDKALSEAERAGELVTPNTRSELLSASSLANSRNDPARSEADARAALSLATDLRHKASANMRLGDALYPAAAAEAPLRLAVEQFTATNNDPANVALAQMSLARFLREREPQQAISLLESSVSFFEHTVDGGHPFGGVARFGLAMARKEGDDLPGAEAAARAAIETTRHGFGPNSSHLMSQLCFLGKLLNEQGRYEEALPFLGESMNISRQLAERDDTCRYALAVAALQQRKTQEAHEVLVSTLADLERDAPSNSRSRSLEIVRELLAEADADADAGLSTDSH